MNDGFTRRGALAALLASPAAACGPKPQTAPEYGGAVTFQHGVASGDPLADRVIIWTRVSPDREEPVPVRWAVASDSRMSRVVASGYAMTDSSRDYTVKIDVPKLDAGKVYHFAFRVNETRSPIGRTKTLPKGGVDRVILAAVSCANYSMGFFNVYEAISKRKDIDAVLHLGDYLYENGLDGQNAITAIQLGRTPIPPVELVTLADYRARHAQQKSDPDLQAAHASAPFICVWDDHELANDDWSGGAANHNPENGEGDFATRKRNALQAYYEWIPIREPGPGAPLEACNRAFQFGDLATLIMLETRLMARSRQLRYATDLKLVSTTWDMSGPGAPRPAPASAPTGAQTRILPTPFDVRAGGAPRAVLDWKTASTMDPDHPPAGFVFIPDADAFKVKLNDPRRALLGAAQEDWIATLLAQNQAARAPWAVFGNQVLMARAKFPRREALSPVARAALDQSWPTIARTIELEGYGLPYNLDSWNGYPAQRARLMKIFAESEANIIVLTGDTHQAWANELMSDDGRTRLANEFGVPSVTSLSRADQLPPNPDLDYDALLAQAGGEVKWSQSHQRGFTILTLTKSAAKAEVFAVSTMLSKDYQTTRIAAFSVKPEKGPAIGAIEKAA